MEITYSTDGKFAYCDELRFCRDERTGYYLNAREHKRLHRYVWEKHNGEIPKGFHVHHKDFDKSNNDISNLELLRSEDHEKLHSDKLTEEEREWRAKNVIQNAMPKAKKWHRSAEGRKWHKEHGGRVFANLPMIEFICEECGERFESKKQGSKFCSNKCRAANRRKTGVDDIAKKCTRCGKEYKENRYKKSKYCKECRDFVRGRSREC